MKRVQLDIDENDSTTGVKTISIVSDPAIESNFVAMSKEVQFVELAAPYKQVLAGLALIPDKDIPRTARNGEKYVATFSKEAIERIRNKFHKELMTASVNVQHDQNQYIPAYLIESFIIDSPERLSDVKAKGIKEATDGAWFVAYKVEDKETFAKALSGELKGFSVEIYVKNLFEKETDKEAVTAALDEFKNSALEILKGLSTQPQTNTKTTSPKSKRERRLSLISHELNT
jgi:hypothetical protein